MDYHSDLFGRRCIALAEESRAKVGFGAVLVRGSDILASGRNRRSEPGECDMLGGNVDYATHAEQAAIISALRARFTLRDVSIHVLGVVLKGSDRGKMSIRTRPEDTKFSCVRCAKTIHKFGVSVCIPTVDGWHKLSPDEALQSALEFRSSGRNLVFSDNQELTRR